MRNEQWLRSGTPASKAFTERVQHVMGLTSRLNALDFADVESRDELIDEIFGSGTSQRVTIYPPFWCDHGLGTSFGERVFINQCCHLSDLGGITIGDRVLIGPNVTICTTGHPVDPAARSEAITHAPIVIESDVWIGASATITPGVTIGHGSVVGAGTVVAADVPPMSLVTGASLVHRRSLKSPDHH